MKKKIKKAVFPVAGRGTRFLPATKASPKEMLPIVDKPLIQYAVEEAAAADITSMVFVTGRNKWSIPDHFDKAYELESELAAAGKTDLLRITHNIPPANVNCIYLRQPEMLGLGHAVLCAKPVIEDEPFVVVLADDLIRSDGPGCVAQMAALFEQHQCSIVSVMEVPQEETSKYGIVEVEAAEGGVLKIKSIVEKPAPEDAPSNLAVVGRYVFTPRIFQMIAQIRKGAGGEIQLTDAIAGLLREETVLAYPFAGKRYDCGTKLGYLQATVEYALAHPELKEPFLNYLQALEPKNLLPE